MIYKIDKTRKEYTYAEKIISGEYLADTPEILACKRFMRDLERQNDDDFPYCYDTTRADRFFKFFESCPNPQVAGEKLKLSHFQYFDYGNIFGWVHKNSGARRFEEVLDWKARGNYKSTGAAAICLYVMSADAYYPPYQPKLRKFELDPSVTVLAVDSRQTKEVRGAAVKMVRLSPELQKHIDVGKGNSASTYIHSIERGGDMLAISGEIGSQDGDKPNLIVSDEWAAHTEEERLNTLCGGAGKKIQFLSFKISTAGSDALNKPAKVDYDRCLDILHGRIIDETYFIIIRQLNEKDDPADFSLYEKCSPVFRDKSAYSERLLAAVKKEYNKAFNGGSEQKKTEYLIKRTNRWQVGSEQKFLDQDDLDLLEKSQIPEEEFLQLINGRNTVNGKDASKVIDITGDAFIFNLPNGKIGIYTHGFMPSESKYRHMKTDKLPYDSYAEEGYLTYIDGTYIDNKDLKEFMCDFEADNDLDIKGVAADNAYCHQLLIDLSEGRTPNGKAYNVFECPQTTTVLNEPCINFQKWLRAGKLVICKNPLFMKHCANAYKEYDKGERMKVAKKNKDSPFRIDLLAATLNAIRKIDLLESENLYNAIASGSFSF